MSAHPCSSVRGLGIDEIVHEGVGAGLRDGFAWL